MIQFVDKLDKNKVEEEIKKEIKKAYDQYNYAIVIRNALYDHDGKKWTRRICNAVSEKTGWSMSYIEGFLWTLRAYKRDKGDITFYIKHAITDEGKRFSIELFDEHCFSGFELAWETAQKKRKALSKIPEYVKRFNSILSDAQKLEKEVEASGLRTKLFDIAYK